MICKFIRNFQKSISDSIKDMCIYMCNVYEDLRNDDYYENYENNEDFSGNYEYNQLYDNREEYNRDKREEYKKEEYKRDNREELKLNELYHKKQEYIELKPYCNDKYSDGNIVIIVDSKNNLSEIRNRTKSEDKNEELDWIVL